MHLHVAKTERQDADAQDQTAAKQGGQAWQVQGGGMYRMDLGEKTNITIENP